MQPRGGARYRVTITDVDRDGFKVVVGAEAGTNFLFLALSWLAIFNGKDAESV
jgi:hypothetical protein